MDTFRNTMSSIGANTPLKRFIAGSAVASAASFMFKPEAQFVGDRPRPFWASPMVLLPGSPPPTLFPWWATAVVVGGAMASL